MSKEKKHPDYILLITAGLLVVFGILTLSSVSATDSYENYGTPFHYLSHQIYFALAPGLILALLAYQISLSFLKRWSPFFLLANLLLLGLVFTPMLGVSLGGATRWLDLGMFSIQPAEFLKLTFFLYLAAWLESKTGVLKNSPRAKGARRVTGEDSPHFVAGLVAFFIILALVSFFLILQPNISTLALIVSVGIFMYFSAGTPLWHVILMVVAASGGLLALIKMAPYRMTRILIFLNPDFDPMGKGYQLKQSLIAIGSGGLVGLGLGMSRQKFGFLPESMSDTIFSILAEEIGFIGGAILVLLFLIFLWRGFKIIKGAPDKFSSLVALAVASWICLQAFVNIGSMIRIFPPMGIPLPFITYGGSHLIVELIGVGILLNISKRAKKE